MSQNNKAGINAPLFSPFQEGFAAYFNDKTPRDGPYPTGHPNREGWLNGFAEAKREFEYLNSLNNPINDNA